MQVGRVRRALWVSLALAATAAAAACAVGSGATVADGGFLVGQDATDPPDVRARRETGPDTSIALPDAGSPTTDAAVDAGDASDTDAEMDASSCPTGSTGPGCADCLAGFHSCGSTCTANGANDPTSGCTLGCGGTACPATGEQTAYCTDAGVCAASCPTGTTMCSDGTCAACCTDSDCPTNVVCTSGTCSGCIPDYGTCATMCDTNLTTDDNCGFCGNACDTGFLGGCGTLGLSACHCKGSGAASNYSCQ
jgi:hypothetical protein